MTATKKKKTPRKPAAVGLPELKGLIADIQLYNRKANLAWNKLWIGVHGWITREVEAGRAKNVKLACIGAAKPLGRASNTVESWFYCGRLMLEHGFDPQQADHRCVRHFLTRHRAIPEDGRLKVVSMIKKGGKLAAVRKIVDSYPVVNRNETENRLRRLARKGKLTKAQLKAEALSLLQMARKVLGAEDCVLTFSDSQYNCLFELGV